jgi:hypothetical protein
LSLSPRAITLIASSLALIGLSFYLTSPIPQPLEYHAFADTRTLLAVDNFWNVTSILPFLVIGLWGLWYTRSYGELIILPGLQPAYVVFFVGIFLTALGSGYYHLSPANGSLVWDRLPMTIGFAGLFTIVIGEFVSIRGGRRILIPLLVAGAASVAYWWYTELRAAGDLRPYVVVQFLPILLIPVILLIYKPAIGAAKYYWLMMLFYLFAKLFEHFDAAIYAAGFPVSGHTLKHLFAALTPATMLYALMVRRRERVKVPR